MYRIGKSKPRVPNNVDTLINTGSLYQCFTTMSKTDNYLSDNVVSVFPFSSQLFKIIFCKKKKNEKEKKKR